jgi:hypothetical protein
MLSCSVNWESKMANNRSYILYMFTFGLLVPLVVIICSYVSILRVVKQVILILRRRGTYFKLCKRALYGNNRYGSITTR